MGTAWLSLGSNQQAEANLRAAAGALRTGTRVRLAAGAAS